MDNSGNSFYDSFDENRNLEPSARRGITCGQIVSVLSLMVAIFAFLFGDNILGRGKAEETPSPKAESATTATRAPLTEGSDDFELVIDDLVWEYSVSESKKYQIHEVTNGPLSNFDLEITLKFEDDKDEFHGIVFRRLDEYQFYRFQITPLGEYAVYRNEEGSEESLVGPIPSSAILTGVGQLNKLRIRAIGSAFEFYINDDLVSSLTDTVLPNGEIGLYTCTCNGSDSSSVSFYNLIISSLP